MAEVVWILQRGEPQARVLAERLRAGGVKAVVLGTGEGAEIELGRDMDLGLALEACPWQLRPALALRTCGPVPGWEGLPCPLGVAGPGRRELEEEVVVEAEPRQVLELCRRGREFRWLKRVHVNLPASQMLGKYLRLVQEVPVALELGLDAAALEELGPGERKEVKKLLGGRRCSVHLPFTDLCPASTDPLVAEVSIRRIEAAAQWAAELGAIQAVAHLGYLPAIHRDSSEFVERFARAMTPVARRLAEAGVGLVLENTFEPSPQLWCAAREALARASGVDVGLCLDLGHANCFSAVGLNEWWEAGEHQLRELHIHDNDARFDQHLPPGQGVIDWHWVDRRLGQLSQQVLLTLEPHTEAHLWATLRALERLWG